MLQVEKLRNILVPGPIHCEPLNLEDYKHLKIAILVDLVMMESSASIAILLLGCKDGQYKRIPTKEHIIVLCISSYYQPDSIGDHTNRVTRSMTV